MDGLTVSTSQNLLETGKTVSDMRSDEFAARKTGSQPGESFAATLDKAIKNVDQLQKVADVNMQQLASVGTSSPSNSRPYGPSCSATAAAGSTWQTPAWWSRATCIRACLWSPSTPGILRSTSATAPVAASSSRDGVRGTSREKPPDDEP
jgi:hypothetical protein